MYSYQKRKSNRRYGYFRCSGCGQKWESSNVYVKPNGGFPETVEYGQECKKCKTECKPYRIEKLICSVCKQKDCRCTSEEREGRHTDLNKPHRADLCLKCRAGYPCQNSY